MIELGQKAKDKITGYAGILTGQSIWLYGCDQYCITPEVDKDGKLPESKWFDEGRIQITGAGVTATDVQVEKPGGPDRGAPVR